MKFHKIIEEKGLEEINKIFKRKAVRAVIMSGHKILLVQSNRGDYKFPGGGVEENESDKQGLVREIREETGYINCEIRERLGTVIERRFDEYKLDVVFEMTSDYYIGELQNEEKVPLQLDDYENNLDFTPEWIALDEAILQNESLIQQVERNSWLKRETFVLKELRTYIS
ncbi:MAG: NUDIX hydrolase [Bacillota bacterium]